MKLFPQNSKGDKRDLLELALQYRGQLAKILDISTDESSEGELAAMVSFAIAFPDGFMALVDTYDVKSLPAQLSVAEQDQECPGPVNGSADEGAATAADEGDGLVNGNGENGDYEVEMPDSEELMIPYTDQHPRCANCEANARETRPCVIGHLKAVGKCFRSGLLNFCAVALALNDQGYRAVGIRIDSGDLAYLSCLSRETFERISERFKLAWFSKLTIVASNDINEETILSLNEQGHKIDCFGIGTHLVTCQRQPALGCVYKMVEINNQPRIKLSQDVAKVTMPGNKNVFRLYGADGHALIDLLQRVDESPPEVGQKVLCRHPFQESKRAYVIPTHVEALYKVYWADGRVTQAMPSLDEVRDRVQNSLKTLRQDHKRTLNPTPYKVAVSDNLYNFIHDLWLQNAPIGELS